MWNLHIFNTYMTNEYFMSLPITCQYYLYAFVRLHFLICPLYQLEDCKYFWRQIGLVIPYKQMTVSEIILEGNRKL